MSKRVADSARKKNASRNGARRADVIIEAIFEDLEAKRTLFARLEAAAKPEG